MSDTRRTVRRVPTTRSRRVDTDKARRYNDAKIDAYWPPRRIMMGLPLDLSQMQADLSHWARAFAAVTRVPPHSPIQPLHPDVLVRANEAARVDYYTTGCTDHCPPDCPGLP